MTCEMCERIKAERDALDKACVEWSEVSQRNYQRAKAAEAAIVAALERLDASRFTNAEHQQAKDILRNALKPR